MGNTIPRVLDSVSTLETDFLLPQEFLNGFVSTGEESAVLSIHINDLPEEILLKIFSYFSAPELCRRIIPVCTAWRRIGYDPSLWTSLKFGSGWAATRGVKADTIKHLIQLSPRLKIFEYYSNASISLIIKQLAKYCHSLQILELQCKPLTFKTVEALVTNCPNIRQLSLYKIEGTDHTKYLPLANLKHLQALELSGCEWADDDFMLAMSANCTKLEYLNLQSLCHFDESLSVFLSNCIQTLRTLKLCIYDISDVTFQKISQCTFLERLTIDLAVNITDAAFIQFQNLKHLQSITLSRLWHISPGTCEAVFGHPSMKNLQDVELDNARAVDDIVIKSLVQNASNLRVLSLEGCACVSDDALYAVVAWSKNLVYLNLERMTGLHGHFLVGIDAMLPLLRVLRVDSCSAIDRTFLENISSTKKRGSKLSVFTEYSHSYKDMETSFMRYPATHQARFQVDFNIMNVKRVFPSELSSYVTRKSIWS